MQVRFQNSPKETAGMNTKELRENFFDPGSNGSGKTKPYLFATLTG